MDFSSNIHEKDFILNKNPNSLTDDDLANLQEDHPPIFFSDNFGQFPLNKWSSPSIMTSNSNHNHQTLIPFMPTPNNNPLNRSLVPTQNVPIYNSLKADIPSKYPIIDFNPYSRTNTFEESMNNITNNNKDDMIYNIPISLEPKNVFDIFHDFQENTIWDNSIHNKSSTINGYDPILDNSMVESHPFDLPVSEDIKSTKGNNKKREWSCEEDMNLKKLVKLHGTKKWKAIANMLGRREGKQCRERWHNHLHPGIKKGNWSEKEDQILVETHKVYGNKWKKIALKIHGRCENDIKNRWNATKRRMHLMKTKQGDKTVNSYHGNILEDYIRNVIINNDPPKANEIANTEDGDNDVDEDVLDKEINLSMDVTTHTKEPLVNVSTIACHVPEPTTFSCDYDITKLFESMDDIQMLIQGWN